MIWGCQFQKNHLPNVILILTDDQGWRIEIKKYDPVVRKHVMFKEER